MVEQGEAELSRQNARTVLMKELMEQPPSQAVRLHSGQRRQQENSYERCKFGKCCTHGHVRWPNEMAKHEKKFDNGRLIGSTEAKSFP